MYPSSLQQVGPDVRLLRRPKSPLKWVGGKAWAVEKIGDFILDHLEHTGGRYFEPFLGGGSMALFMGANYPKLNIVGDVVAPLVEFFQELKENSPRLAYTVAQIGLEYGLDEKGYYAVRAEEPDEPHLRAARFLYLNRLGFNGLWRENASGKMNVPAGSRTKEGKAMLPSREIYSAAGLALGRTRIELADFEVLINEADSRDLVYVDPPYFYAKGQDGFTDYSKDGFGVAEQERLALALYRAHERGVTFVAHNSLGRDAHDSLEIDNGEGVRYWYGEFAEIIPVKEPRRVAANGNREDASCAVITNDSTLASLFRNAFKE